VVTARAVPLLLSGAVDCWVLKALISNNFNLEWRNRTKWELSNARRQARFFVGGIHLVQIQRLYTRTRHRRNSSRRVNLEGAKWQIVRETHGMSKSGHP
jgi:hypothetical protein